MKNRIKKFQMVEIERKRKISEARIKQEAKKLKESNPKQFEAVERGEKTISEVIKEIKKEKKKTNLATAKQTYINKSIEKDKPEIHLSDVNDFLRTFEDNSIDLLITDPPYITDILDINSFVLWTKLAISKVKQTGRIYICTGAYPKEIQAYLNIFLNQSKFILDNPLIWTYRNTLGITPKMKYNLNYQMIWHLYSDQSKKLDTSITNEMFSVQDINAPDGRVGNRLHTWQKPDELARRLIKHSTKENDLVVDCFVCTGTFLIQAANMNRKTKGCDNSIENLKTAKERGCIIIEE